MERRKAALQDVDIQSLVSYQLPAFPIPELFAEFCAPFQTCRLSDLATLIKKHIEQDPLGEDLMNCPGVQEFLNHRLNAFSQGVLGGLDAQQRSWKDLFTHPLNRLCASEKLLTWSIHKIQRRIDTLKGISDAICKFIRNLGGAVFTDRTTGAPLWVIRAVGKITKQIIRGTCPDVTEVETAFAEEFEQEFGERKDGVDSEVDRGLGEVKQWENETVPDNISPVNPTPPTAPLDGVIGLLAALFAMIAAARQGLPPSLGQPLVPGINGAITPFYEQNPEVMQLPPEESLKAHPHHERIIEAGGIALQADQDFETALAQLGGLA